MPAFKLKISSIADKELEEIYIDGFKRWGEEQADIYYDNLLTHFDLLCQNPYIFQAIDYIRPGYRRSVCGKHSIYYRIVKDNVEIMAILKHEDVKKRL